MTVKLHYAERGAGFPVLLLHGFPFDHQIWEAQAEALSEAYRVITPDLRGHGRSPVPEGVYSMDLMAHDVIALLDDLNIPQAVWVGHSMGGYITMAALRLAPARVAGVVFVATQPHADSDKKRAERLKTADKVLAEGSQVVAESMRETMCAFAFDTTSQLAESLMRIMLATSPVGVAGALRGMAERPDSVETLRALTVPVEVIAGAEDQIVALDIAKKMVAEIPTEPALVSIPEAGHMVMVEQPRATTIALQTFLDAHIKT